MISLGVALPFRNRPYFLAFFLATGAAIVAAGLWGWESRFEIGRLLPLPYLPEGYQLEDLWFKDDGSLALIMRNPGQGAVAVGTWTQAADQIRSEAVDLVDGATSNGLSFRLQYSQGIRPKGSNAFVVAPYGVSEDGTMLAAVRGGSLVVGPLASWNQAKEVSLSSSSKGAANSPVDALVFTAPNVVTLVHADGSLDHCDYQQGVRGNWSTKLPAAPLIWSRGSRLLVSTPQTGEYGLLEVQGAGAVKAGFGELSSPDVTVAALAADGSRVVYGTANGIVYSYDVKPEELAPQLSETTGGVSLPVSRPVRALALLPGGQVLVGGDFREIYLLDAGLTPRSIAEASGDIRLMAVHQTALVYATADRLVSTTVEQRLRPAGGPLGWILAIYATVLALVDFIRTERQAGATRS